MLAKFFIKEWRENSLIFFLAVLMILALAILNLSDQRAWTLYFAGMFLWLFLPFAGMLLGSGAFYSEFKDNAWIYLFSRPIRRESIWIIKFVSSLSVLLAIYLIFLAVMRYTPGLAEVLEDITPPSTLTSPTIAILALVIAFSMSILYEKQFVIIFITVLIGIALGLLFQQYLLFLYKTYFYYKDLKLFPVLIALGFLISSLLTIIKADFSQPKNKVSLFLRYIGASFILVFVVCTLWVSKGRIFTNLRDFRMRDSQIYNNDVYFDSYFQGFLRYSSGSDAVEKIGSRFELSSTDFSIQNDKIVFFKEKKVKGVTYDDLWIMNTDGSGEKPVTESYDLNSPFHFLRLSSCEFSPDGSRIAFISQTPGRRSQDIPQIWTVNLDGTESRKWNFPFPGNRRFQILGWLAHDNSLIIWIYSSSHKIENPVVKFSLGSGDVEILVENHTQVYQIGISPQKNYLTTSAFKEKDKTAITTLVDLRTGEQKDIFTSERVVQHERWSPDEEKLAFWIQREIWVYDLLSGELKKVPRENEVAILFDWVYGGKKLVITEFNKDKNYLRLLNENLNEIKRIALPSQFKNLYYLKGLNEVILLRIRRRGNLWRLNLETEEFKKIY